MNILEQDVQIQFIRFPYVDFGTQARHLLIKAESVDEYRNLQRLKMLLLVLVSEGNRAEAEKTRRELAACLTKAQEHDNDFYDDLYKSAIESKLDASFIKMMINGEFRKIEQAASVDAFANEKRICTLYALRDELEIKIQEILDRDYTKRAQSVRQLCNQLLKPAFSVDSEVPDTFLSRVNSTTGAACTFDVPEANVFCGDVCFTVSAQNHDELVKYIEQLAHLASLLIKGEYHEAEMAPRPAQNSMSLEKVSEALTDIERDNYGMDTHSGTKKHGATATAQTSRLVTCTESFSNSGSGTAHPAGKNSYSFSHSGRNLLQQTNAGDSMASPVSKPVFTHSGTPLVASSYLKRSQSEPDYSQLHIPRGEQVPPRPIHAISVENLDLSDSQARMHITQLLDITCERLNLMPRMGELKFIIGAEPFDPDQEKKVLGVARQKAKELDLPTDLVERFIQAQMDIAKHIQLDVIELNTQRAAAQKSPQPTAEERQAALNEQKSLRPAIGKKLEPLLSALKPLVEVLSSPVIQREISRQLDNNNYNGECARAAVREEIKESLKRAAGLSQIH